MNIQHEVVSELRSKMDYEGAKELARKARLDRTTLYNVLKGKASSQTLRKLASFLTFARSTTSTP